MKKLFFSLIFPAIILLFSISAFAQQNITTSGNSQSIDVKAKTVNAEAKPSYSVDISWEDMTFTYTQSREWNPNDHTYTKAQNGEWNKTESNVTVTNHSNVPVSIIIAYNANSGTGISGEIKNGTAVLAAGEVGKYSEAKSMTATLVISGIPTNIVTSEGITVGSVTVTIGQ